MFCLYTAEKMPEAVVKDLRVLVSNLSEFADTLALFGTVVIGLKKTPSAALN